MAVDVRASDRKPGAWSQAIAAFALVGMLGGGFWLMAKTSAAEDPPSPAVCSADESSKTPDTSASGPGSARRVSGAALCEALNRPDLAGLLGVPGEIPLSAHGGDGSIGLPGSKHIAHPTAEVGFDTYTVHLSATYDGSPVAGSGTYLRDARKRTVLGHPAFLHTEQTVRIRFRFDGGESESGPGVAAHALTVALDAEDSGGSFDLVVWREDGGFPDEATLTRIAEKVLPTIEGWAPAGK
ncbi:DUF6215 domain-containing protein [Streptomyces castrisilvae]|uniref:DUF6215 domain-containing protein n=1 Tax=Streptomyces castrisilvae TaxID=3033811 RepID=A0ABY9HUC3_9ACTN|nr:DUF6215 domain-containing protein [Streptomyces sp. Mut1]WLQ37916.1 DUF6215 domain-containing protein [Streptomyces sp. Mut1]